MQGGETMTKKDEGSGQAYGIGAVARLTGLTDHTIRVWERRHGAVIAERTGNGRRIYRAAEIEKLRLLKLLTDHGLSISKIAGATIAELREQLRAFSKLDMEPAPDTIAIAVLGETLPAILKTHTAEDASLDLKVADTSKDRFEADIQCHSIDVVIVECAILNASTRKQIKAYGATCGAEKAVIVYRFGRAEDIECANQANTVLVRAPAHADEITAAVRRTFRRSPPGKSAYVERPSAKSSADWQFSGSVPPRRFSQQQLQKLATAPTEVDCECPRHLAELVGSLSAFEIYSANCAARDDEDAALHHYLHQTTAEARARIEEALEKLAEIEGLQI